MKSRIAILGIAALGLILAVTGFENLRKRQEGVKFQGNPFAIRQSGYGMILARLSQDTVNKVWHLGVEQVNPEGHVHGPECAHLPGHGEGEEDHSGHGHEEEAPAAHSDHEIAETSPVASEVDARESGHVHGPDCEHEHGPDCEHDHGAEFNPLAQAKDWLVDMKSARYARTNPYGINEAHRLAVAKDIEETLLRSYNMDPTNYGVYNAYYLFLTIHELRATPLAKDHARKVSNLTIGSAFKEDTNPAPWLTAAAAVLNLFFLDQEKWRDEETDPPTAALEDYRQKMGYCLQQYAVLKQRAIAEKRWKAISDERRQELDEHEQFATKAFAQFDAMLARQNGEGADPRVVADKVDPDASAPVAENAVGVGESSEKDR